MSELNIYPPTNSNIIQGQPFSVVATISGEVNYDNAHVIVTQHSPNLILINALYDTSNPKGKFSQTLIFLAKESSDDYTISFSANTASNPKASVDYKSVPNSGLDAASCGLSVSPSFLFDPNPVNFTGPPPKNDNPNFITASINPTENGKPISNYEMHLRTKIPVRIFTPDMQEFKPYSTPNHDSGHESPYYDYLIPKKSEDAVSLRIYATVHVNNFVIIETQFSNVNYDPEQILFISTEKINISSEFDSPNIEEADNGKLTRSKTSDYFNFEIPGSDNMTNNSHIIGFVTNKNKSDLFYKKQLCVGFIKHVSGNINKYKVPYSDMYEGDNYISYIAINKSGNPSGSLVKHIYYNSTGNNNPVNNGVMVSPDVYDQYGNYIYPDEAINIHSIGEVGLTVKIKSDPDKKDQTIQPGDNITIKAYISYCDDMQSPKRPLPIVLVNDRIKDDDIKDGYYIVSIKAKKLIDYKTTDGDDEGQITIEYSRLAPNQRSIQFIRGFDTYYPQ